MLMPNAFDLTIYALAGALVLLAWALCRLLPRVPESGGIHGVRFWLAMVLGVVWVRTLSLAIFTAQTTLYDASDAVLGLVQAGVLYGLTMHLLQTTATLDNRSH